jgi:hypothetical protein
MRFARGDVRDLIAGSSDSLMFASGSPSASNRSANLGGVGEPIGRFIARNLAEQTHPRVGRTSARFGSNT